jgi:secreted trypsin-like serine protease
VKFPQEVLVMLGKHDLNDDEEEGSVAHAVNDLILHDDWDPTSDDYDADIALVVLGIEVDLNNTIVAIVCLPPARETEFTGYGIIAGWGISERSIANDEAYDSKPNELQLPAVTRDQCIEASYELDSISSNRTFCAGFVNQNKSACQGDSGGGFYQYDKLKRGINLAGIVSASLIDDYKVCRIDIYSIFTDVSKYINWIEKKMEGTIEVQWTEVDFECEKETWR